MSRESLTEKLKAAEGRVQQLQRELKNATAREKRSKTTLKSAMQELKAKNLLNEELEQKLALYTGTVSRVYGGLNSDHFIALSKSISLLNIKYIF